MLELWPYQKEDAQIVLSWITSEESFYQWSAGKFGEYPATIQRFNDEIFNGECWPFAVVDDSELVGFFIIRAPEYKEFRMCFIILSPEYRGKGYGKKLISLGLAKIKGLKPKKISLGVFENNPDAYKCYKSVGFKEIGSTAYEFMGEKWNCIEMEYDVNCL